MSGTVKIWWHDGAVRDVRYHDIPVVNEPELGFETLAVDVLPVRSSAAPEGTAMAIIETDVDVRYKVLKSDLGVDADGVQSKPIARTGHATDTIGVGAGDTISFVETG